MRKIWLVKFPTGQYKQDVKGLARQNNLVVYDEKYRDALNPAAIEANPPRLTRKGTKAKPKPKAEVEPEPEQ